MKATRREFLGSHLTGWLVAVTLLPVMANFAVAADFYAYYTRVESRQPFERYSRTGDAADVVVAVGEAGGRLVFWRGSSYLPYWETGNGRWYLEEIIPRHGDGDRLQPDRVNAFSHVAIVENTAQQVVICWRYLPQFEGGNPPGGVSSAGFAEEYFTLTPEGRVTRVIRQGVAKVEDWNDSLNAVTQVLQLRAGGVSEISRKNPRHSKLQAKVKGNPQKGPPGVPPALWFKFDEGVGDSTTESISRASLPIVGPKTIWKKGVSGTALEFDGYTTVVALPAVKAPALSGSDLTLEAWLALGAYPWNWAPLVQQGDNDGFFLGVDSHGYPGFGLKIEGQWRQLSVTNSPPYNDNNHLGLFTWHHLVGTYSTVDGMMHLYLNGKEIAGASAGKGGVQTVNADIRVGKAAIPRKPTEGTHDTLPSEFGIDGLIDEVRIYRSALERSQVAAAFASSSPGPEITRAPDMEKRKFPVFSAGGKFGATYTHLPYYETWENLFRFGPYPDVVVGFDQLPTKFVFWRGVSFIPMMVNETNQWFTEEFNETWGSVEAPGDNEPMSDKPCYHSHVRVLENHAARVVVEWRYYLENPDHHWANWDAATGWGDVADWYFYIYPDGVATVRMHLYTSKSSDSFEWNEQIAVFGEGQHPEGVVRRSPVMTLVDSAGKATPYDWNPDPPHPKYPGNIIQMIHFTGQYSPFAAQDFDGGDVYGGERTWYSVFPTWNHWPTAQANSSGRNASFPDRASHSSMSHLDWPLHAKAGGDVPFQEKVLMEGMTKQRPAELAPLARSWLHAPALMPATDCRSAGYDLSERAYLLAATGSTPAFRLAASVGQPIVNPGFVVRDWNSDAVAKVEIDGRLQPDGPQLRQGITRDPNGKPMLVVWCQRESTTPMIITLHGAKPGIASANLPPSSWVIAPQLVPDSFAVRMQAARLPGVGCEYCFECIEGPGHSSGWLSEPCYTDEGLPPSKALTYRVKARNSHFAETEWSAAGKAQTPAVPPPVIWSLDEGAGTKVGDSTGKHDGVIQGPVSWVAGVHGQALHLDGQSHVEISGAGELHSNRSFTWTAWIRTTQGGTILARAGAGRKWQPGGKVLFVANGRLRFDVGWAGATGAKTPVADGAWHHVAVTVEAGGGETVRCYVDGRSSGRGSLDVKGTNESGLPIKIGFCNEDFPRGQSGFVGDIDDVRWFEYALMPEDIQKLAGERGP